MLVQMSGKLIVFLNTHMKYTDLYENADWDKTPYSNRQDEIEFLKRRCTALQHFATTISAPRVNAQAQKCRLAGIDPFRDPEYIRLKQKHSRMDSAFHAAMQRIKDLTIKNTTFVFTGFRSTDLENKIRSLGGRVVTALSGKVDYLVAADPSATSGKIDKATEQGTRIISKAYLLRLLRD